MNDGTTESERASARVPLEAARARRDRPHTQRERKTGERSDGERVCLPTAIQETVSGVRARATARVGSPPPPLCSRRRRSARPAAGRPVSSRHRHTQRESALLQLSVSISFYFGLPGGRAAVRRDARAGSPTARTADACALRCPPCVRAHDAPDYM